MASQGHFLRTEHYIWFWWPFEMWRRDIFSLWKNQICSPQKVGQITQWSFGDHSHIFLPPLPHRTLQWVVCGHRDHGHSWRYSLMNCLESTGEHTKDSFHLNLIFISAQWVTLSETLNLSKIQSAYPWNWSTWYIRKRCTLRKGEAPRSQTTTMMYDFPVSQMPPSWETLHGGWREVTGHAKLTGMWLVAG